MDLIYDNFVYELQSVGGISTYWYELSKRFLTAPDVNIRFLEQGNSQDNVQRALLNIPPSAITIDRSGGQFLQRFKRVSLNEITSRTLFHSSYFRMPPQKVKVKKVVTIHDFTHDLYFKGPRVWLHNVIKKRAILESDAIITVSENTRRDLLSYYPKVDPASVHTIYNGVSDEFVPLQLEKPMSAPFFLYVGSRDNYKNFNFAVRIASAFKAYNLVIVGGSIPSKAENEYLYKHLGGRHSFHRNISIPDLNKFYNRAFCLLYPSSYEGFGIPLLEAMKAGCPFIALNCSSIPEVAGDAGILMNSLDIDEAITAVKRLENDRQTIVDKGFLRAQHFSWDFSFNQTYKLYKDIL